MSVILINEEGRCHCRKQQSVLSLPSTLTHNVLFIC